MTILCRFYRRGLVAVYLRHLEPIASFRRPMSMMWSARTTFASVAAFNLSALRAILPRFASDPRNVLGRCSRFVLLIAQDKKEQVRRCA